MEGTKSKWSRLAIVGAAAILVIFAIIVSFWWRTMRPLEYRLPDRAEISAIVVVGVYDGVERPNRGRLVVPGKYFDDIISCLGPCRRDHHPCSWRIAGKLEISCRNDENLLVAYYYAQKGDDAFSVVPIGLVGEQTYYRGGDVERLGNVIERARLEAREGPTESR